jgi:hypothetical protein
LEWQDPWRCIVEKQVLASLPYREYKQVKTGHTWTQGGLYLGNGQKSRRDLDNYGLPSGCETLVRRREKTDGTGDIRG